MRIPLNKLKWAFLFLYLAVILSLAAFEFILDRNAYFIVFGVMFFCQFLFIFGSGSGNFCKPVKRRRRFLPLIVCAVMMSTLAYGFINTFLELFEMNFVDSYILIAVIANWVLWLVIFYFYTRGKDRFIVFKHLLSFVIAGSLLELLAAVPSHIITSRRPGCLANLGTGIGIIAGICVMLWSFGPGLFFMFFAKRKDS